MVSRGFPFEIPVRIVIIFPMDAQKLYIAMVGLPARGKSTIATRLKDNLHRDSIPARIFNNGDLRRRLAPGDTSYPEFYDPTNRAGVALREKIARINIDRARRYLAGSGHVAILDATNVSPKRREMIARLLDDHPILFVECLHEDAEILEASIERKILLPEFSHLSGSAARESFRQRIRYYENIYAPIRKGRNYIRLDSLYNRILRVELADTIPFFDQLRDSLVTDTVRNLYLIRHGETRFNLEDRIGGDSPLTDKGMDQARALAAHFRKRRMPLIFTSRKKRTIQTAEPIAAAQDGAGIISLAEFNEIDSGQCECMSYEEIRQTMPEVYRSRKEDKYGYVYPGGEGYVSMKERVDRGIKKALYLSGASGNVMIIGHRAVNRMILSHFLYRREEDVPYIYIPQDRYYHIVATQNKKLFQLKAFQK